MGAGAGYGEWTLEQIHAEPEAFERCDLGLQGRSEATAQLVAVWSAIAAAAMLGPS